jgi:hypothetical protein
MVETDTELLLTQSFGMKRVSVLPKEQRLSTAQGDYWPNACRGR